ncbi:fluoride efflux transporter CrcB [Listeria sp. PSOL-1]|uniref:fluoride efflux transporter CrcB n=1 Tax=Listeria sp. PSOL-1 TaxID=1844999 RepID=UPI0013D2A6C4|nr:fluoride efflux transporter CrcB [Listeria sp. PSOL-1]
MYYVYIAIFSALGGMSRYGISLLINANNFPIATLVVNLLGSFLLAIIMQYFAENVDVPPQLIAGLGTGFVGSFTTFSSFSVENIHLLMNGQYFLAISYIVVSLCGGLLFAGVGYKVSWILVKRRGL